MRLDVTVVGGVVLGMGALLFGFLLEGGRAGALLEMSAAIIVFGGTLGATAVSFSLQELAQLPRFFRLALTRENYDPVALITRLCNYTDLARRQRILALEPEIPKEPDRFVANGLQMIVDNTDRDDMRQQLETEMYTEENAITVGANVFEAAGGFAPTMGIVGTVMGLVHVLGSITGAASALASAIGTAFTATMYGVASANLLWLPMANNLRVKAQHLTVLRQIAVAGLDGIHRGVPGMQLRYQLFSFIEQPARAAEPEEVSPGRRQGSR